MDLTITAYSTALFSTWIFVDELSLLIDAGDGVTAGLLSKSRKIKHVFITHPDRDHLSGMHQFTQLNSREGFPIIHYPKDSGSFPALQDFLVKFDPHISGSVWKGIQHGESYAIKSGIKVKALRNEHVKCPPDVNKSLSYKVFSAKQKLKREFLALSQEEIKMLVAKHGRDHITETQEENVISFSGDTPVDDYSKWDNSKILIHEATFLKNEIDDKLDARGHKHSKVEEVLKMVKEINVEQLILTHFSTRYSKEEIDTNVLKWIKAYKIQTPVFLVYPGEIKRDVLRSNPINA